MGQFLQFSMWTSLKLLLCRGEVAAAGGWRWPLTLGPETDLKGCVHGDRPKELDYVHHCVLWCFDTLSASFRKNKFCKTTKWFVVVFFRGVTFLKNYIIQGIILHGSPLTIFFLLTTRFMEVLVTFSCPHNPSGQEVHPMPIKWISMVAKYCNENEQQM